LSAEWGEKLRQGKKGAKTGALVGAGLALLGPGNHIQIPAGTLIEMHLKQPLTIQ